MIIDAISGVGGGGGGTTIVQKPTVSVGTYTYDGTAQGPTITGLDTQNTIVTNATATNAGTYTLTIALKNSAKMVWNDMTTADLTYEYTIQKANQTITLSSNSVTLDPEHLTSTVTVSGAEGVISVTSSASSVATASVSGSTITISNVNETTGSATITVSVAGTTNYNPATDATISVAAAFVPDGSTVTPTDDVQIWLHCAGITDKSYTTLNEVLADSTTLATLISSQNAVDYMVRSTSWATDVCANSTAMSLIGLNNYCANTLLADSTWLNAIANSTYIESVMNVKVPTMTSNTAPYGEAFAKDYYSGGYEAWHAFDGNNGLDSGQKWNSGSSSADNYLGYKFTNKIVIKKVWFIPTCNPGGSQQVKEFKIQGSNDGTTWIDLSPVITLNNQAYDEGYSVNLNNSTEYQYYRVYLISSYITNNYSINELQFYGREDV